MQEIKKSNVTIRSDYPIYKRHRYEIWPRHIGNIYIERGNQKSLDTKLSINGTDIEEFDSGETYACLGQDEGRYRFQMRTKQTTSYEGIFEKGKAELEFRAILPQQSPRSEYLCNSRINTHFRYARMDQTKT